MNNADESIEEIFGSCLEAVESGRETIDQAVARYPDQADELRPLLETAVWFAGHKAVVAPRPGFIAASKGRLLAEIKQSQVAAPAQVGWLARTFGKGSWRLGLQLALIVAMLACLVVGSTGVALASQSALPGDTLYPLKTGLEQAQLLVTLDKAQEIQLHMQFSQLRLIEIQELLQQGRYSDIVTATDNYRYHIQMATLLLDQLAATNPAQARILAARLGRTFEGHLILLDLMAGKAPPEARLALAAARLAVEMNLEEIYRIEGRLVTESAPTPTSTQTATSTPSVTPTPSSTPSPTLTRTPTEEPSQTPTPAGTLTATPTPTPTRTRTATPTRTFTRTPTRTAPTPTRTRTSTPRPGSTATRTPLPPTPTVTPRPENTPTPTSPVPPSATSTPRPPTSTPTVRPPTNTPTQRPTNTPQPTSPEPPGPSPYPPPVYPPPDG
jgi:Domain of unknown function (DUF5667)